MHARVYTENVVVQRLADVLMSLSMLCHGGRLVGDLVASYLCWCCTEAPSALAPGCPCGRLCDVDAPGVMA